MRIAIMAAGGVGGFLAAHLLRHGADDVALVARGAHLAALRDDGLTLVTDDGSDTRPVTTVTDDPATIGPVDAVLFAVKLADTERAAEACRPLLGDATPVVPFQNGVESRERIRAVLGDAHACAGCCYVSVAIDRPGVIRQAGRFGRFLFAEPDGTQSPRLEALRAALVASGVEAPVPDDIDVELWTKFSFLVALSGLTAAGRTTIGAVRDDPEMADIYRRAIEEAAAVARARGVALPGDVVEKHLEFTATLPAQMRASQAVDLERGKPLEVDWLSGAVVRLGAEAGVDTPVNATLHAVLKPFAGGQDG
ncbi:MAG: 2-dehydropantoate 2-reductase [Gammaproteobacteria bacterium]|nr:2-dehydropantoate 2-reductase [Gammaproteobacteria bacterium]